MSFEYILSKFLRWFCFETANKVVEKLEFFVQILKSLLKSWVLQVLTFNSNSGVSLKN